MSRIQPMPRGARVMDSLATALRAGSLALLTSGLLCATSCFQTVDGEASGQATGAVAQVSAAGVGTFPVELQTPPIGLDPNDDTKTTTDPCVATTMQALQIRKTFCAGCHDGSGALGAPLTFILDDAQLIGSASSNGEMYVVPGDPAHSRIYQRAAIFQDMPPASTDIANAASARPTISDLSVLEQWIICLGAPPPSNGAGGSPSVVGSGTTIESGGATAAGGSQNEPASGSSGDDSTRGGIAGGGGPPATGDGSSTGGVDTGTAGAVAGGAAGLGGGAAIGGGAGNGGGGRNGGRGRGVP
jgi:hypothetical protein